MASLNRICRMQTFEGRFTEINNLIGQNLQFLSVHLQCDLNAQLKEWRAQDLKDQAADSASLQRELAEINQISVEGFASAESHFAELKDITSAQSKQVDSIHSKVDQILKLLLSGKPIDSELSSVLSSGSSSPSSSTSSSNDFAIDPRHTTPLYAIEFKHHVATGSFAKIYSGAWFGNEVAIKSVYQAWSDEVSAQFFREVEISSLLRCAFIVQFYSACLEQNRACLIMEWCHGGNLFDRITRDRRGEISWAYGIARDVASGIAYLHAMGFWHRDIKSQNVLLSLSGRAKLCDFRKCKDNRDESKVSRVGTLASASSLLHPQRRSAWTPEQLLDARWMPPEIFNDPLTRSEANSSSDVFGFGVILFELFSGSHPYESLIADSTGLEATLSEVASLSPAATFLSHHALASDVPSKIAALVGVCTAKVSGQRPTIDMLIDDLSEEITFADIMGASINPNAASPSESSSPSDTLEAWSPWSSVYSKAVAAQQTGQYEVALSLFDSIIQSNDPIYCARACTDTAMVLIKTNGDFHRAMRLFEFASEAGYHRATIGLVQFLFKGSSSHNFPPDKARAIKYYQALANDPSLPEKLAQHLPALKKLVGV